MGDPLQLITANSEKIEIIYYGGTSWRWNHSYEYTYNKDSQTWFLSQEYSDSYSVWNIDSTYTEEIIEYTISDSILINDHVLIDN